MKTIHKSHSFTIVWNVYHNTTRLPFDFTGKDVEVSLFSNSYKSILKNYSVIDNVITADISADELPCGVYSIVCRYSTLDEQAYTSIPNAFQISIRPIFDEIENQVLLESYVSNISPNNIITQFNSLFVRYLGSSYNTRNNIPMELRRTGLIITYINEKGFAVTERASSSVQKENNHWGLDVNWSRIDELSLSGDISISSNGTWIINGVDSGKPAIGSKGDTGLTPWLKTIDNRLHFSYDNINWELCSDYIAHYFRLHNNRLQISHDKLNWEYLSDEIAAYFRFQAIPGGERPESVGKIQMSRDNKTWTDLSPEFTNYLRIAGYVAEYANLPTNKPVGTIIGVGPTTDEAGNSSYRFYVYDGDSWVDNGKFTSIAAGIVQETGNSENVVMSQKAVTENYSQLNSKLSTLKGESLVRKMGVIWDYEGNQKTINITLWGASALIPLDALYIGESGYSWITGGGMSGYEGSLPAVVMFDKDKQFLGYIQAVKQPNKLDLTEFVKGTKYIGFNSDNINTTIDALKGEQLAKVIWNDINEQRQSINMANSDLASIKEQTQELRTLKYNSIIPQMGVVWNYEGNKQTISTELWGASVLIPIDALYVGNNGSSFLTNGGILGHENSFPAVVMFDKNKNFLGYIQTVKQTNKLDLLEFVEGTMYIGINSDNINTTIDALKGEQIVRTIWNDIAEQKGKTGSISTELLSAKEQLQKFRTLKYESLIPKMGVVWDYEGNQITIGAPLWGASVLVPLDALYIEEDGYSWITNGGMLGYENSFPAVVMFDRNKQFLGYIQNVRTVNKLDLTEFVEGTKYIGFNSDGINTTIDALKGEQLARTIWDDIHSMQPSSTGIAKTNTLLYSSKTMLSGNNYSEVIPVSAEKNQTLYIGAWIGDYTQYGATINVYGVTGNNRTLIVQNGVINRQVIAATFKGGCDSIEIESNTLSSPFVQTYIWGQYNGVLNVAASNAPVYEKENAHIICDGVNDEDDLQCAAELSGWVGFVNLSRGTFYVDSFKTRGSGDKVYGAIVKPTYVGFGFDFTLRGVSKSRAEDYAVGTRIVVRDSAYDNIPDGIEPCVIGSPVAHRAGKMRIEKIAVELESNTHPICIINGQYLGGLIVDSCVLSGGKNAWSDTPPAEGTVGIRGIMGDCDGSDYVLSNTYAIALYEGFQLGGEHLFAYELGTRFCYYGYTFGNYDYGSWFGDNPVTLSHPLTLINCCDEGSRKLPLFAKCGVHNLEGEKAKQQVDLINFNVEIHTSQTGGAEELTEGSFCGNIDFTSYGTTNSGLDTSTGLRHNRVDTKFWEEGSGRCFRTRNMTHELMGTTSVRNGYFPTFMQRYFDTDLKKEVICIDEFTKEWVDSNGNKV